MRKVTVEEGMAFISGAYVASIFDNVEAGTLTLSDLSLFTSDYTSEAFRDKFGVAYTSFQPSNETAWAVRIEVQADGSSDETIVDMRCTESYDELQTGMREVWRGLFR